MSPTEISSQSITHQRFRPLPEWLVSYRRDWLQPDLVAGLTTGAVIIPKAMAYATIAGLLVQVGLYTAFVPMVIYAVLGTSRLPSVSTTTTLAILTAAQLDQVVPNGDPAALLSASATLTLLVGAALVLACLLRLSVPRPATMACHCAISYPGLSIISTALYRPECVRAIRRPNREIRSCHLCVRLFMPAVYNAPSSGLAHTPHRTSFTESAK